MSTVNSMWGTHIAPPLTLSHPMEQRRHIHPQGVLWLQHCVWEAGRRLHGDEAYECVQMIANLDRYRGLQAPVVLASLVSSEPGIMRDVVRANTLTSRAQSELHHFGAFLGWEESPLTAGWLSGLRVMVAELRKFPYPDDVQKVRLPGVMYQQPTLAQKEMGVIYKFKGGGGLGVVGQWLWKPWRKHAKALDPWGFSPPQSDQLLDWGRIMANKRVGTLEMRVRLEAGEVEPKHLGVTLPYFTEWALPYILIRDEDTDWAGWHDIDGLERVCHTQDLADHEQRPVQFLLTKPFRDAQTYPDPPPGHVAHAVHLVRYRTNSNTLLVAKRCESPYCIPRPWSRCTLRLAKCSDCGHAIC